MLSFAAGSSSIHTRVAVPAGRQEKSKTCVTCSGCATPVFKLYRSAGVLAGRMSSDTATASSSRTSNSRHNKPELAPLGPDQQLGEEFFKQLLAEEDDSLDLTFLDPLSVEGSAPTAQVTAEENAALQQLLDWTGSQPFHSEVCMSCVLCKCSDRAGQWTVVDV